MAATARCGGEDVAAGAGEVAVVAAGGVARPALAGVDGRAPAPLPPFEVAFNILRIGRLAV